MECMFCVSLHVMLLHNKIERKHKLERGQDGTITEPSDDQLIGNCYQHAMKKIGGHEKRSRSANILKKPGNRNRNNFGGRCSYGHSGQPRSSLLQLQMSKNQASNGSSGVNTTTAKQKLSLKKNTNDMISVLVGEKSEENCGKFSNKIRIFRALHCEGYEFSVCNCKTGAPVQDAYDVHESPTQGSARTRKALRGAKKNKALCFNNGDRQDVWAVKR